MCENLCASRPVLSGSSSSQEWGREEEMPICGWEKELKTRKFSIWLTLSRELKSGCVPTASEDPIEPKKRPGYGWHCLMQSIDLPRYSNLMSRIFILPFTPHPHSIPRIRLFPGLGLSLAEWALLIPSSGPQLLPALLSF